jgi:copper(I)-binding protein
MIRRLTIVAALVILAGCGEARPPLVVSDVVITAGMPGMKMSAGYLTFANNSDQPIAITSVTSPQFDSVEMHETLIENDIARMREIPELAIPAHGSVVFERGGKHLMLMNPTGANEQVTLNVYSGDMLLLVVTAAIEKR